MNSKNFLIQLVSLIFFIFLLNYLAMKFYWYLSIWYFDMILHFLGGFWLGLAFIWFFKIKEITPKIILKIIFGVLFISIFWELFEILINDFITKKSFNSLDTISDIFFGMAGGFSVLFYFLKKIIFIKKI